jgi:hypothetical protein
MNPDLEYNGSPYLRLQSIVAVRLRTASMFFTTNYKKDLSVKHQYRT